MNRPVVALVLIVGLFLWGCNTPTPSIPPGVNPDELLEQIDRRGRGEETLPAPPEADATTLGDVMKVTVMVTGYCLVGTFYLALLALKGLAQSGRL